MNMYLIGKDLWEILTSGEVMDHDLSDALKFKNRGNQPFVAICLGT